MSALSDRIRSVLLPMMSSLRCSVGPEVYSRLYDALVRLDEAFTAVEDGIDDAAEREDDEQHQRFWTQRD